MTAILSRPPETLRLSFTDKCTIAVLPSVNTKIIRQLLESYPLGLELACCKYEIRYFYDNFSLQ